VLSGDGAAGCCRDRAAPSPEVLRPSRGEGPQSGRAPQPAGGRSPATPRCWLRALLPRDASAGGGPVPVPVPLPSEVSGGFLIET